MQRDFFDWHRVPGTLRLTDDVAVLRLIPTAALNWQSDFRLDAIAFVPGVLHAR
jgi:hypothetical protein